LNVLQRVGGSIGTAVLTVVFERQLRRATSAATTASAFGTTFTWVPAITALATAPALLLARTERRAPAPQPPLPPTRENLDAHH
jgi:hypothetical protein